MKKALIIFILASVFGVAAILFVFRGDFKLTPDSAAINDAVMTAAKIDDESEAVVLLTNMLLSEYEGLNNSIKTRDYRLRIFLIVYVCVLALAGAVSYLYCEKRVLSPFRRLRKFARDIAAGELDVPLEMDKGGVFGAFTESFDVMRDQLKIARENAREAERAKKELVASLSHDIKTPVASIKAAVELSLLTAADEKEKARLEQIGAKAEQINTLITDMFHATLQELRQLAVNTAEIHSTLLPGLIKNADHKGKAKPFAIPDCIVLADTVRLQQVFDNIIGNSYKYAGTDIEIHAGFEGNFLAVTTSDFGGGIPAEELPLITGKFYRGKNSADKSGYGLGLYISKSIMEKMNGKLECRTSENGFSVRLMFLIAGAKTAAEGNQGQNERMIL
jgi:signal transduction histidine kinase